VLALLHLFLSEGVTGVEVERHIGKELKSYGESSRA
jgi:hypothetical protein